MNDDVLVARRFWEMRPEVAKITGRGLDDFGVIRSTLSGYEGQPGPPPTAADQENVEFYNDWRAFLKLAEKLNALAKAEQKEERFSDPVMAKLKAIKAQVKKVMGSVEGLVTPRDEYSEEWLDDEVSIELDEEAERLKEFIARLDSWGVTDS